MENTNSGNRPEEKFRAGGITATIWKNTMQTAKGPVEAYAVTVARSYKDKSDDWKESHSLRLNDIPKARHVLNKAYDWMLTKPKEDSVQQDSSPQEEVPVEDVV